MRKLITMTRISKEHSLFNTIRYGEPRHIPDTSEVNEKSFTDDDQKYPITHEVYPDEKLILEGPRYGKSKFRRFLTMAMTFGMLVSLFVFHHTNSIPKSFVSSHNSNPLPLSQHLRHLADNGYSVSKGGDREIFEVRYPEFASPSYGESLTSQALLNHYFGDSWGKPAIVDYSPPDIKFNKVVLTLNTTSNGVQYDRLAHFFFDGVPIWRTSTMEPGGHKVHSSFSKDVSDYTSLFKSEGELMFKLDNLMNSRLTGGFNVTLTADYYYDKTVERRFGGNSLSGILTDRSVPKVFPLGVGNDDSLHYLPLQDFKVKLPSLNSNTTRLKLSIFTSGNAEEEFWYSNVLNANVNKFKGNGIDLFGHGPIRTVLVKYNDQVIANAIPEPVIFTGGLSPALWSPMVSTSAFDLKAIEIDLTALIPSIESSDHLEISIGNGGIEDGLIGSNWITAANLLVWENSIIKSSESSTVKYGFKDDNSIINFGWDGLKQIVTYESKARLASNITYELVNGTSYEVSVSLDTLGTISNIQTYSKDGTHQVLAHNSGFDKHFKIVDIEGTTVVDFDNKFKYPLLLDMNLSEIADDISYDIKVVNGLTVQVDTPSYRVLKLEDVQNGTSVFTISPSGNHGSGKNEVRYKLDNDRADIHYYRHVKVDNDEGIDYDFESFDGEKD